MPTSTVLVSEVTGGRMRLRKRQDDVREERRQGSRTRQIAWRAWDRTRLPSTLLPSGLVWKNTTFVLSIDWLGGLMQHPKDANPKSPGRVYYHTDTATTQRAYVKSPGLMDGQELAQRCSGFMNLSQRNALYAFNALTRRRRRKPCDSVSLALFDDLIGEGNIPSPAAMRHRRP